MRKKFFGNFAEKFFNPSTSRHKFAKLQHQFDYQQ